MEEQDKTIMLKMGKMKNNTNIFLIELISKIM